MLMVLLSIGLRVGGPQIGIPEICFTIERTPVVLNLLVMSMDIWDHLLVLLSFLFLKKSVIPLFVRASLVDLKVKSSMTSVSGDASACGMGLFPELSIIVLLPNVNSICDNGDEKVQSGIET
jgi:hypothetical protein